MVHEALIKLRRSLCEVMSALLWSIKMFCYLCPSGSPVFLSVRAQDAPWDSEKAQKVRLLLDEYELTAWLAVYSTASGERQEHRNSSSSCSSVQKPSPAILQQISLF